MEVCQFVAPLKIEKTRILLSKIYFAHTNHILYFLIMYLGIIYTIKMGCQLLDLKGTKYDVGES